MKKFKYAFPRLTFILIIVGLVVCTAGFVLDVCLCASEGISRAAVPIIPVILYTLMFIVTIAAGTLLASVLGWSSYTVDEKNLTTSFGFIKSRYPVQDIDVVVLDRETNKLLVYMKDESYIIIVIKSQLYPDFVQAVLDVNREAGYAIQSLENTPDDKKD